MGFDAPPKLPRGSSSLPPEVVVASQHRRIVEGAARAVAEKGYADATVADIIGHAGVSRTTFYQLFRDKEDCFSACFRALAQSHLEVVERELARPGPHPDRLLKALHAYLERIDADRWFARAFIGEAESATQAVRQEFLQARARLESALRAWLAEARRAHPAVAPGDTVTLELVNTALAGFVVNCVRTDRALLPCVPDIAAFMFASFGMPRWAERERSGP